MAEKYSPNWISAQILQSRADLEAAISRRFAEFLGEKFLLAVIFMFSVFMVALPSPFDHVHLFFLIGAVIAVYLFFLSPWWSTHPAVYVALWLGCAAAFTYEAESPFYFAAIILGYLSLWFTFKLFARSTNPQKIWAAIAVSLILFLVFTFLIEGPFHLVHLQLLRPQRFLFLILLPLLSSTSDSDKSSFLRQIFFPMNFVFQSPFLPMNFTNSEDAWKSKIRGFFDILIGTVFLFAFYFTSKISFAPHDFANYVRFGVFSYLETYILSCGSTSLPVGFGRLFGFNLEDVYSLPLLASSPFERWRRWNTYYYRFFSLSIFLPLARRLKSLFVPILATFAVTILFHSFPRNLIEFALGRAEHLPLNVVWFFMAHGLAVYISLRWKFTIYDGSLKKGWLGVLVTWAMMIGIHMLNRWGEN